MIDPFDYTEDKAGEPFVFVQWKGTDVCGDYHCSCGAHFHIDGMFVYAVECPHCHAKWQVGFYVAMRPLPTNYEGCAPRVPEEYDHE